MATVVLVLYNLLLPVFCVLLAPGWLLRMARRGGLGPRLWERVGCYDRPAEFEPSGVVYVHAVSVGEVRVALKLIAGWRVREPERSFVLAATTSTGFDLACREAEGGLRVIYSPLDLPLLVGRMMRRFEPRLVVLIESELWPNLLVQASRRAIPVALANARLSPRSARRYGRLRAFTGPLLNRLELVCAQAGQHAESWRRIGVREEAIAVTGSVKFDPEGVAPSRPRAEFSEMLGAFGAGRPVVLAASTHAGEEVLVARAVRKVPGALAVLLPRHAERRMEVTRALQEAGFEVVLRSRFQEPRERSGAVLVVDSTGELRDWTTHADVVVIGKSFLGRGGQNPVEAISAGVPVICGPSMENFEPLVGQLRSAGGVRGVADEGGLAVAIAELLGSPRVRNELVKEARQVLAKHHGATQRTIDRLVALLPS